MLYSANFGRNIKVENSYQEDEMKVSTVLVLITIIICGVFLMYKNYELTRDVEAVAHRAQVAADANDMLQYMEVLQTNLKRHRMDRGHTALLFKKPDNDLELLNRSIEQIISRLNKVVNIPHEETAYQVALDDIRDTIRELEAPSEGFVWVQWWFLYFTVGIACIWLFVRFSIFMETGR